MKKKKKKPVSTEKTPEISAPQDNTPAEETPVDTEQAPAISASDSTPDTSAVSRETTDTIPNAAQKDSLEEEIDLLLDDSDETPDITLSMQENNAVENQEDGISAQTGPAEDETESTDALDETPEPDAAEPYDTPMEKETTYKKLGLYLHIPFCKSKCAYCDFYSTDKITVTGRKIPDQMRQYIQALKNHMRIISERTTQYNIDSVFIGGGTPTALPPKLLLDLVKEVERDFYTEDDLEFTVEMNPATADKKLLKKLHKVGVNRLSIGLQSSHNHELAALSRIHTVGDFTEAFQMAREAGFDNINIDVMYGIPEQTRDTFMETLAFVCSMKPEHISMYNLRIEDGTPFGERRHMLPLPDEDAECDMYFDGIEYLASQGYRQYEISNFAKDGKECRHNLKYWHGEEYIGCGVAAHSYFGGSRFSFRRALEPYCKALEQMEKQLPKSLLDENYRIDKKEEVAEYLMLRFRLAEGIDINDFKNRFGGDFDTIFGKRLQFYIDNGYMQHENARYFFTPKGMFVSNYILSRIIPFEPKYSKSSAVQ